MQQYKSGIVDVIVFYAPYGEELLDFRINLLKDHVDWFIITEASRTQLGDDTPYRFEEIAEKRGFPMEKIIYVKKEIPPNNELYPSETDIYIAQISNVAGKQLTSQHVLSKTIERMQKDAFFDVVDQFDYDTVFIVGDSDEIINPDNIEWLTKLCKDNPGNILKIPLIYLQGRADLRVFNVPSNSYREWNKMLYFAQRHHFDEFAPSVLRKDTDYTHRFPYVFPTHDGVITNDLGWHFSWMGKSNHRRNKYNSYTHKIDDSGLVFDVETHEKILDANTFKDGSLSPDGQQHDILKKIDLNLLPDLLFSKREYIDFFFGLE